MAKKNYGVGRRAWKLLHLALLWARKGGVVFLYVRGLSRRAARHDQIYYGERQLSFGKTPIFHVKMHRPAAAAAMPFHLPNIPCMSTPKADFDEGCDSGRRKSFLKGREEEEEEKATYEEDEIDLRAEAFIVKFYEQIKLQRQISYLE
ncbi:uncharacterized protein LOC133881107 [Alnus glutinosa]|uniref:uncharacterized protein LOC133881107 n=1 Tax=Alnus glutinosa TaxID=3517 RepID=UPI002D785D8E|nr:uncharacterized protein LOC133881107 [Alnus glutinosa]